MTKSLSKWWAGSSHRALGATDNIATRLALALTPVRSVIRVIDDHVPPMTVEWAAVTNGKSVSATDFGAGQIIINPLPITERKVTTAAALDVVTGFAMHEASHGKHSRERYKYLVKNKPVPGQSESVTRTVEAAAFRPMRVAIYLWNLVEDVRIEWETSRDWPGFAPYFEAVLRYMWANRKNETTVDGDTPYPALVARLQTVFIACRYPDKIASLEPGEAAEAGWWQEWQGDYLTNRVDTPTTIQRGLDRLAQDEAAQQEMKEMTAQEKKEAAAGEKIRAQIERLMREGIKGTYGFCVTQDGEVEALDEATADAVDRMVREGLIEVRPVVFANGASNPTHHVRKPMETKASRRAYVGKPDAETEALRSALVFRSAAPQHDVKLLRQGTLDDEELYRWAMDDYRVFSERIIDVKPDVFMALLVDMSGSMSGRKLRIAQRLAQLFVWALHEQEGVDTQVWGHTGDGSRDQSVDIFRLWEKGDPMSRLGLIDTLYHNNNYDGHAISYVVKQAMEHEHPQKVVIVLSDGLPSGYGYGGTKGMAHMRQVCTWAQRNGVTVLQIAIDDHLNMRDQAAMFGSENVIPFKDMAALPRQLAKVMGRYA